MKHVFVESNWVFDVCSPTHRRKPEAERLVERARQGELELHLPGICLREGAESVRRKCQPRLGDLGDFRRTAEKAGRLSADDGATVTRFFEQYTADVRNDLDGIDAKLDALGRAPGLNVFALSEPMLERVLRLRATVTEVADLNPFDEAILAAVVVRAEGLAARGERDLLFCTLDADLLPWHRDKRPRPGLERLYREAGLVTAAGDVAVRNDFQVP